MAQDNQTGFENKYGPIREKLLKWLPESGEYQTPVSGFFLFRKNECECPENCFYEPAVGVILQGQKHSYIGSREYRYGEGWCLVNGIDLPAKNYILDATPENPFLGMGMRLDKSLTTQLAAEIPPPPKTGLEPDCGLSLTPTDPDILDAFSRLLDLLEKPEQIAVMAPMIIREIHYRLLIGPQGSFLRAVNTFGTQGNQVAQAISWLRKNYKEPVQVDELAKKVNMATSTFHRHFKQLTSLSPLQFQKRLRLYEAQRLMLVENEYASSACMAVGYESPTQFNREYKRLFGEPPSRNISKVRELRM